MKGVLAVGVVAVFLLAGCGDKTPEPVTVVCPDGKTITLTEAQASDGKPPASHCPVAPSIHFGAASYNVGVFRSLPISWTVDSGTHAGGHTMLTVVRLSHHSIPVSELTGPTSYGIKELPGLMVEHQNLPISFNLTTGAGAFTPDLVGMRYMRVYAQIRADDLPLEDYWSDEVAINITAVQPTGKTWSIIHSLGGPTGTLSNKTIAAKVGDAINFRNDDALEHTFKQKSKPACAATTNDVTLGAGVPSPTTGPTPPILLDCPGPYTFVSEETAATLTVTITASVD